MKFIKIFTFFVLSTTLYSQSFYVLSGVDSYDAVVVNMSPKVAKYSADIESLMQSMSKEIGVNIEGHPSRGLFFLISDISMGDTIGLKIELVLGEYVLREGSTQPVFGVTYMETRRIAPDFKDEEEDFFDFFRLFFFCILTLH